MRMQGIFITSNPLPMRKYIILMAVISFVPSIVVSMLIAAVAPSDETMVPNFEKGDFGGLPVLAFLLLVIISPLVETLLMSFGIWLLSRFVKARVAIVVMSAFAWACLHSMMYPLWGLAVFWPFVVFSCAYITWRKKSWIKAVWVVFCIHALQNLVPGLAVAVFLGS